MDETSQEIGALKAEVANLKSEVHILRTDVRELLTILHAAKGSWRTVLLVGTIATGVASAVATVVGWVYGR